MMIVRASSQVKDSPGTIRSASEPPGQVSTLCGHDSQVAYSSAGFDGPGSVQTTVRGLARILEGFDVRRVRSHFGMKASQIRQRVTAAPPDLRADVTADFAQSGFVQIMPRRKGDAKNKTVASGAGGSSDQQELSQQQIEAMQADVARRKANDTPIPRIMSCFESAAARSASAARP